MFLRIKEWSKYQHYKHRNPPWIKLYREFIHSYTWIAGNVYDRELAIACMLLAASLDNKIPADISYLARLAHLSRFPDFTFLINTQFVELLEDTGEIVQDASKALAVCVQYAPPELETETETETKTTLSGKPDISQLNGKKAQALEVLEFLNAETGKAYRPVDANLEVIVARLKEGYTVADMRKVIVRKCSQWKDDEKMEIYLRPMTLFGRQKLAQYSGELVVPK